LIEVVVARDLNELLELTTAFPVKCLIELACFLGLWDCSSCMIQPPVVGVNTGNRLVLLNFQFWGFFST
jgi:hypothetical protein